MGGFRFVADEFGIGADGHGRGGGVGILIDGAAAVALGDVVDELCIVADFGGGPLVVQRAALTGDGHVVFKEHVIADDHVSGIDVRNGAADGAGFVVAEYGSVGHGQGRAGAAVVHDGAALAGLVAGEGGADGHIALVEDGAALRAGRIAGEAGITQFHLTLVPYGAAACRRIIVERDVVNGCRCR